MRDETSEGKEGDEETQTEEEVKGKYCHALQRFFTSFIFYLT